VALRAEKDEFGMPLIDLHWSLDDHEMQTYYRGRELALEKLDQLLPGLNQNRMADPEAWPDKVIGTWHHSGTTRMHSDLRKGVVDADAKVHGIDNLFIVGSSIFPTSGSVSPTAVTICLALRLGEHLKSLL
jgi:choline dehydrogenase-like flavoprotein